MDRREDAGHGSVAGHGEKVAGRHGNTGVQGREVPAEGDPERQSQKGDPHEPRRGHGLGIGRIRLRQGGQAFRRDDPDDEALKQGVHGEHDEGRQKERPRDVDLRMAYLLPHGAAGLEPGETPPDHGRRPDQGRGTEIHVIGEDREIGQADMGHHHQEPDEGHAPEKEHEAVLQPPGYLDAADVGRNEERHHQAGDCHIAQGQFPSQDTACRLQVKTEGQGLAAGHRHQ